MSNALSLELLGDHAYVWISVIGAIVVIGMLWFGKSQGWYKSKSK